MAQDVTVMSPEDPTNVPTFTLAEVADLERPAEHRDAAGKIDYIYDGINFWCDREGMSCSFQRSLTMPQDGWRHHQGCRCPLCSEAHVNQRRQMVKP